MVVPDGRTSTPFSMVKNAARVKELDKGKTTGEVLIRYTKMSLGFGEVIGCGLTFNPSAIELTTIMDGATGESTISNVLKATEQFSPETSDAIGEVADFALGGKGIIDNAKSVGESFLKTDGLSEITETAIKSAAEISLIQLESSDKNFCHNIACPIFGSS